MPSFAARKALIPCVLALGVAGACAARTPSGGDGGALDGGVDAGPGIPARTASTTCRFEGSAEPLPSLTTERAFPGVTFASPVHLTAVPTGADRLAVVEQPGRVLVFPNREDVAQPEVKVLLDLRERVQCCGEEGLLSVAFHPRFADNRAFYVYYTARYGADPSLRRSIISRFEVRADAPDASTGTESVILEIPQPFANHNGGQLLFGPDGMLYISLGDGGGGGDPFDNAQRTATVLGKILRIDVDRAEGGRAYAIPADNPFVGVEGARGEIWAMGLRNPWRMSFDRALGTLWAGDVGQSAWEEIDVIVRGANYGWRRMEGNACMTPPTRCEEPSFTAPLAVYGHDEGCAVTGGFVYRGARVPEVFGAYVYSDYCSGNLWALRWDGTRVLENARVGRAAGLNVTSFGEDRVGELYLVAEDGTLNRLRRSLPSLDGGTPDGGALDGGPSFPRTLSATGCYGDVARQRVADGLVPYDVNAALWSDGAEKRRFFFVPGDGAITPSPRGGWRFPLGTILMKEFWIETERARPESRRIVETRFLLRRGEGWEGYSYRWNDGATEGDLLTTSARRELVVREQDGGESLHVHGYPSRGDCLRCHTTAAGGTLGLETAQLNGDFTYPSGARENQLRALARVGFFGDGGLGEPASLPRLRMPFDTAAPVEDRARAYLHANCSGCHRPGGGTPVQMDLRFDTPMAETRACDSPPQTSDLGVAGARILAPGHPDLSTLYLRMSRRGSLEQMPPLGSALVDEPAAALLRAFIAALRCP